ncbi:MAG TPA: alpha/beta hydrolase-fold protein [archaeon]|nr:alpha/beta hydrolase-fold protein [archaeon]
MKRWLFNLEIVVVILCQHALMAATSDFYDRTHFSRTFGEWRHYRILLPRDYETSGKHYPVIYYFHGHSGRFMGEQYGNGQVFLPEMIDYVRKHDVIVVCWDGYVEDNYSGLYGGSPYDIQEPGKMDFGPYFEELVAHIDSTCRTLADRQHRATCGLSMGGFMSLYISGRYPHLVGSASAYNPGHEFFVGPPGAKVHYMLKNHVLNHCHTKVRLIRASGDYISQYHEELRDVYSRTPEVEFVYRRDEVNRHWVTRLDETFDFHMSAFEDVGLTAYPKSFDYDNAFDRFSVWGYDVTVENKKAGFVCMRGVERGYFRIFTREYYPDGPSVEGQVIRLTTPNWYGSRRTYRIMDYSHRKGMVSYYNLTSSPDGRLSFELDGSGHDISILNGKEARAPVLLPLDRMDAPIVRPDDEVHLPIKLLNTCDVIARNVEVALGSDYRYVEIEGSPVVVDSILPGEVVDLSMHFKESFVSSEGYFQHCRLMLDLVYSGWHGQSNRIDVQMLPTPLEEPDSVEVLDGRRLDFPVFHQAGNSGGGFTRPRAIEEGLGNGDGKADPGEEVTIWVCVPQGIDPFDKHTWHRTKVYTDDPYVTITEDIAQPKELEWTSVKDHTSRFRIAPDCPKGHKIELILKNESYSFYWQPDYQFGGEFHYQAFQLHRNHLHRCTLTVGE